MQISTDHVLFLKLWTLCQQSQTRWPRLILHVVLTVVPQHQTAFILQRYSMETFYKLHYTGRRGAKFSTCRTRGRERVMDERKLCRSKISRFSHTVDKTDVCNAASSAMEVLWLSLGCVKTCQTSNRSIMSQFPAQDPAEESQSKWSQQWIL